MQTSLEGRGDDSAFPAFLHQMRQMMGLRQEPDLRADIRPAEAVISAMTSAEQNVAESLKEETCR